MAKIYYSTQPVWWNTGNEIKPNRAAFNKFTFTEANNFNISWIDEMTVSVIVPNNNVCTLLKIEDNIDNITKYFYLLEVVNRTSVNQECVYELDVWLTYLLPYLEEVKNIKNIQTIRTLDVTTLKPTINVEPVGVPTGNIISKQFKPILPNNPDLDIFRGVGKETNYNDRVVPIPGVTTNIYYVFKSKNVAASLNSNVWGQTVMQYIEPVLPNYILVPVLDIGALGLGKTYNYKYMASTTSGVTSGTDNFTILNSHYNLNELVRVVNDFGNNGLGEFLGVWIGPNFFRFKSSGIKYPCVFTGNNLSGKVYLTSDIIFDPSNINHKFNRYGSSGWCTFLALRVSSLPLELSPLLNQYEYNNLLTGLKYQENSDSNIVANASGVSFNNSFSYSNGLQTTTINISMPVAVDSYYNLLAAQRNTLNTSLALAGVNSAVQGLGALVGLVPPKPTTRTSSITETRDYIPPAQELSVLKERLTQKGPRGGIHHLGWETNKTFSSPKVKKLTKTRDFTSTVTGGFGARDVAAGVTGLVRAGVQFASTLAQQKAYRADLRISTSSAVLNENDRYLNWYKIASSFKGLTKAQTDNKTGAQIKSLMNVEFLSGPEIAPGIGYTFYGVDSQPQNVTISDNMETYLQIHDNLALHLQNDWGIKYTPTIKEAMLSLLSNGIRITGDVIK